jgi:hypothetical protein
MRCRTIVRLKILLIATALVVTFSDTAAAKFGCFKLTISGPGMTSPHVIRDRRAVDRLTIEMLVGNHRVATERPRSAGPAYSLEYVFGVSDQNGSRIERIRQLLYPFAAGGPVVVTHRGQTFDTSYGAMRFSPGWFKAPRWVLARLERVGLPSTVPQREVASAAQVDRASSGGRWAIVLALLMVGGTAVGGAKRRRRRVPGTGPSKESCP